MNLTFVIIGAVLLTILSFFGSIALNKKKFVKYWDNAIIGFGSGFAVFIATQWNNLENGWHILYLIIGAIAVMGIIIFFLILGKQFDKK